MQNPSTQGIIILIVGITILLLLLISFIITIVYKYKQKQNAYFKEIEALKTYHKNTLLQSQLEIHEQTIQNISREIHDNIGQKLTLAKLYLNSFDYNDRHTATQQISDSINIIGQSINDLSHLSHSMSSEIILNNGLINGLEVETAQLSKTGIFKVQFSATGSTIFLDSNTELVLFRIVQEVLNNIIKHARASVIDINLHYTATLLEMQVTDNGVGFTIDKNNTGTGLLNIKKRADMLKGKLVINSSPGHGTIIKIEIPLHEYNKEL